MGKLIDLIGQTFGRWTVLSFSKMEKRKSYWRCKCICGTEKDISSGTLKNGNSLSCGCYKIERLREMRSESIIGEKYGRLKILEKVEDYISPKGERRRQYLCLCDCGNTTVVLDTCIKKGTTTSCGCYKKELLSKNLREDFSGKIFGKITILSFHHSDKYHYGVWNCVCECGREFISRGADIKKGKIKSCGCLQESFIANELKKYLYINYESVCEYRILRNPETSHFLPYDIYIPFYKIFIEINGIQHYVFIKSWHKTIEKFNYNKCLDRIKRRYARKNGYYLEIDLRKIKTVEKAIELIENKISEIGVLV